MGQDLYLDELMTSGKQAAQFARTAPEMVLSVQEKSKVAASNIDKMSKPARMIEEIGKQVDMPMRPLQEYIKVAKRFSQTGIIPAGEITNILKLRNKLDNILNPKWISFMDSIPQNTRDVLSEEGDYEIDVENEKVIGHGCEEHISKSNIICSGIRLFARFNTDQLRAFENDLYENYAFANKTTLGQEILEIIKKWDDFIDFDVEELYHTRPLDDKENFHFDADMRMAPVGVSSHGRFNDPGRAYYYCASTKAGAIEEIKKHGVKRVSEPIILKPIKKDIKLLDLSDREDENLFLQEIRLAPYDANDKFCREYLLPCYVGACCRYVGIQGIKYYGSEKYNNYVTWDDRWYEQINNRLGKCN